MSDELTEVASSLSKGVADLAVTAKQLDVRLSRNERFVVWLALTLVICLCLVGAFGILSWKFKALADCQAAQFSVLQDALNKRSESSKDQSAATKAQLQKNLGQINDQIVFLSSLGDPAARAAAFQKYVQSLNTQKVGIQNQIVSIDNTEKARSMFPLPRPGQCVGQDHSS